MLLRHLFLFLSNRRRLRRFLEHSPAALRLTSRFIAGRQIDDAVRVTRQLNLSGFSTTLDYLGESVTTLEEAAAARDVYLQMLEQIHFHGLHANVSLKLTQLGIGVSEAACRSNVAAVAERAAALQNFVRVDMESSAYTGRTLALIADLHGQYPNIGAVVQSYLHRSERDLEDLIRRKIRVRLVKGAYDEPPSVAFQKKSEVDAGFDKLARLLLLTGNYPALATHDEALLASLISFAEEHHIAKDAYEIQMLYGIRRDLQARFVTQGHKFRVYVPFGGAWYPYFMRRLAERPANVWFVARHLFRR
ncbi:MAG TPA: proline dehydrogenase family protein [Bryobacterales bacterium]|nr:proline dehydrogenase family protein [Bryobacterales bacterium]